MAELVGDFSQFIVRRGEWSAEIKPDLSREHEPVDLPVRGWHPYARDLGKRESDDG